MKYFTWISATVLLTSCGGWTDTDKSNFREKCIKSKFSNDYCECALEKAMGKYSTFNDMTATSEDEIATGNLFIECIDKDTEE